MHNTRNTKYGFIILSPNHNVGLVQSTLYSVKRECRNNPPCVCVTSDDTKATVVEDLSKICRAIKGGKTITSLINTGLANTETDWNIIIFEGSQVTARAVDKLCMFAKNPETILFPIVMDYDRAGKPRNILYEFDKGTLNGLTIHKETFNKVGKFSDNPISISKMFWQMDALEKGCQFRSILGAKII